MASEEGLSYTPQPQKAGPGGCPQGQGVCGRRAGEQFLAVRLSGNVFYLRAVAAPEAGAPNRTQGSPVGVWSCAVASSSFPDTWHLLLQLVR